MINIKMIYRLKLAASQWRNEHTGFEGLRKNGKRKSGTHYCAGNYFLKWCVVGDFETAAAAQDAAQKIYNEDKMQHEFIIETIKIASEVCSRSSFFVKEVR